MTGVPPIPDVLTNAVWQRNKGNVAKVFKGETGIGALLIELDRRYKAVHWGYFDPRISTATLPKPQTRGDLAARRQQANGHNNELELVRAQCRVVQTACTTLAAKWKKSVLVPSSTRKIVEDMGVAADHLAVSLRSIGEEGYEAVEAEITRREHTANQMLETTWVVKLKAAIILVKATPTVAKYKEVMHQKVRGMGTALSQIPDYRALYDHDWAAKVGDGFMTGVADGAPVTHKVVEVEAALGRYEHERDQRH